MEQLLSQIVWISIAAEAAFLFCYLYARRRGREGNGRVMRYIFFSILAWIFAMLATVYQLWTL